jgi:hypothetical protein
LSGGGHSPDHRSKSTTTNTINQTGSVQTKSEITASTNATKKAVKEDRSWGVSGRLDPRRCLYLM